MKEESKNPKCSLCKHWNNKQAELDYSTFYGICTSHKLKFNSSTSGDCVVLDRENRKDVYMGVQRFESQSNVVPRGAVDKSRYCFVTEEDFGCVNFEKQ